MCDLGQPPQSSFLDSCFSRCLFILLILFLHVDELLFVFHIFKLIVCNYFLFVFLLDCSFSSDPTPVLKTRSMLLMNGGSDAYLERKATGNLLTVSDAQNHGSKDHRFRISGLKHEVIFLSFKIK